MKPLGSAILQEKWNEVRDQIHERLRLVKESYLVHIKKVVAARLHEDVTDLVTEANVLRQGRTQLIRRRIRKGKLQRNVRRSAVKGFTLRRGKLKRIPAIQRIHMRITQRRAARKRKGKLQSTLRKRRISMRKRHSLGIR